MAGRRRSHVGADFIGAASPVGSVVRFRGTGGQVTRGRIGSLRTNHADVIGDDGNEWEVLYTAIIAVESAPVAECTLRETEAMAKRLLVEHQATGKVDRRWTFGFDLATTRAGVCRYRERRIDLAVSYCLAATRAEIEDTILHEIAHAIVGPRHNHDAVWKAKAREIGCQGKRCHRVQQSVPKWVGECGCGQQWFRHVLQRRMIGNRICAKCRGAITWRRNRSAASGMGASSEA